MAPSEIDDDGDEVVVALRVQSVGLHGPAAVSSLVRRARTGGSRRGRRQNKLRDFRSGVHDIMRDHFGVHGLPPIYDEADFDRRFRMPRVLFQRIYDDAEDDPFFQQRIKATGQLQAHPLQKIVGALRVLAYGEAADRADEYVRISGSTIRQALGHLTRFIVQRYQSTYLRERKIEELTIILARNEERGLPGCIGSLDCSH